MEERESALGVGGVQREGEGERERPHSQRAEEEDEQVLLGASEDMEGEGPLQNAGTLRRNKRGAEAAATNGDKGGSGDAATQQQGSSRHAAGQAPREGEGALPLSCACPIHHSASCAAQAATSGEAGGRAVPAGASAQAMAGSLGGAARDGGRGAHHHHRKGLSLSDNLVLVEEEVVEEEEEEEEDDEVMLMLEDEGEGPPTRKRVRAASASAAADAGKGEDGIEWVDTEVEAVFAAGGDNGLDIDTPAGGAVGGARLMPRAQSATIAATKLRKQPSDASASTSTKSQRESAAAAATEGRALKPTPTQSRTSEDIGWMLDVLRQELGKSGEQKAWPAGATASSAGNATDNNNNNGDNNSAEGSNEHRQSHQRSGHSPDPRPPSGGFHFTRRSKKAVYSLASVAKHEESTEHIVQNGGIEVLIEAIRLCVNTKNVSVSRAHNMRGGMLQGLDGPAQGSERDNRAGSGGLGSGGTGTGGGKQANGKPTIHRTAEYILKNACLILGYVALNGQYRKQVIEQGGVGALVGVLRCYSALCVQSQRDSGFIADVLSDLQHQQQRSSPALPAPAPTHFGALGLLPGGHGGQPLPHQQQQQASVFGQAAARAKGAKAGTTPTYTIARRAAGALANLAHEDVRTKNLVREEGGIPALVLLLKARDFSVQVAAASTLKAIAFRNEDNKNQIVECGALGSLVCMLRSSDPSIHYEAVAVMSGLVHSSAHIKKLVLNGGALQPLINLLSSTDMESRREAALLLGQFANVQDPDYKTKIVQRGALGPLIAMLSEKSVQVSEMAAFAIGRLAQNVDNQAGIVQAGGLQPLLDLLRSKSLNSQHNAAFALYGLSDNDDNVPHFLKSGCVSILLNGTFHVQASKDCVRNTLRKLEEKIAQSHVLNHLRYLLSSEVADLTTKYYIATGLAFLAPQTALHSIFMENHGMDILFLSALNSECDKCQQECINAIHTLGKRSAAFTKLPTIENGVKPGLYTAASDKIFLGEDYLNNPKMSDVIFEVEETDRPEISDPSAGNAEAKEEEEESGSAKKKRKKGYGREPASPSSPSSATKTTKTHRIHAHKIALLAASDRFCEMIADAAVGEDGVATIPFPGVEHATVMKILSYVYSGGVQVTFMDNAHELLEQAEKLQLDGLKYACETFLMSSIDAHSFSSIYDLAVKTDTLHLQKAAVWYAISEYSRLVKVHGPTQYTNVLKSMLSVIKDSFQ